MRGRFGIIPLKRGGGFTSSIQLLREAGLVSVLVDQHAGDGGIWMPLFGRLASTSPLAAMLALRTGAALVPVSIASVGRAHWRLSVEQPIAEGFTTVEELTAAVNTVLEAQIRASPRDWFWVHNRWKTPRPDFLLAEYKRGVALPPGLAQDQLKPFRILIRSTNWLGDAVMSAPALRAIRAGRPDARLTVLTPAKLADFWATIPEVSEVITTVPGESVFAVARKIRRGFDVAFVFPNSIRAALEVFLAGIPRRVGYRRPWRGRLINQVVPDPPKGKPSRHQVHHYLKMAAHAGADIEGAAQRYADRPEPEGAGWLGLCPGAEYGPAKRWMTERFAAVAQQVHEQSGLKWLLFGVEKDRPVGDEIAAKLGENGCRNLIGQTSLAELIAQLRQCRLLLTNDTGTMHLAAHLGVPVVAIFGSTEPALTGPRGRRVRVLRHHVVCSPCFQAGMPAGFPVHGGRDRGRDGPGRASGARPCRDLIFVRIKDGVAYPRSGNELGGNEIDIPILADDRDGERPIHPVIRGHGRGIGSQGEGDIRRRKFRPALDHGEENDLLAGKLRIHLLQPQELLAEGAIPGRTPENDDHRLAPETAQAGFPDCAVDPEIRRGPHHCGMRAGGEKEK